MMRRVRRWWRQRHAAQIIRIYPLSALTVRQAIYDWERERAL